MQLSLFAHRPQPQPLPRRCPCMPAPPLPHSPLAGRLAGTTLVCVLLLALAPAGTAQTVTGTLLDAELDEPLSFAAVAAHARVSDSLVAGATTDYDGAYALPDLPPGDYTLRYERRDGRIGVAVVVAQ